MRRGISAIAATLALGLAGCDQADMYKQGKAASWDRSEFLRGHMAMQLPVAGTVPRDEPNRAGVAPRTVTVALLERGHAQYDIFCTPCHGLAGNGDGMIVQRGFPKPPPFSSAGLVEAKAQTLYDVITDGKGAMYGHASQIPPADRWAIVAYIRALQLSQKPVLSALSADDKAKLDGGGR